VAFGVCLMVRSSDVKPHQHTVRDVESVLFRKLQRFRESSSVDIICQCMYGKQARGVPHGRQPAFCTHCCKTLELDIPLSVP